jgi:hypothetical protein
LSKPVKVTVHNNKTKEAYYMICKILVHGKSEMFYSTRPWSNFFLLDAQSLYPMSMTSVAQHAVSLLVSLKQNSCFSKKRSGQLRITHV